MKNQKGITLIALVITIIVMLILVGVTINVAFNAGLFGKAQEGKAKTQKEADREELLSAITGAYDAVQGTINEDELNKLTSSGWTIVKNADGTYTCTSPKKNVFTVDSNGSISDTKSITLDKTSITLEEVEDEEQLTATTIGLEGSITWESSNTGVATVTGSGKTVTVTAVANGNATITATCGGKTASCTVTVGEEVVETYYYNDGNTSSDFYIVLKSNGMAVFSNEGQSIETEYEKNGDTILLDMFDILTLTYDEDEIEEMGIVGYKTKFTYVKNVTTELIYMLGFEITYNDNRVENDLIDCDAFVAQAQNISTTELRGKNFSATGYSLRFLNDDTWERTISGTGDKGEYVVVDNVLYGVGNDPFTVTRDGNGNIISLYDGTDTLTLQP